MTTHNINLDNDLNSFQVDYLKSSMERSQLYDDIYVHSSSIKFRLRSENNKTVAEKALRRLIDICNNIKWEVLYESVHSTPAKTDPMDYLLDSRQAIPLDNGVFLFQGEFLRLMRFFENFIYAKARDLGASDQQYPVLWPIDLFKDINYLNSFPQNILLVCGLKENNNSLEEIATRYDQTQDFKSIEIDQNFDY